MSLVVACLPLDELIDGTTYLSKQFENAKIMLHQAFFDPDLPDGVTQILLYVEEDFSQNDNIFRLMACRNFQYLFFSKAANPRWRENSGPGKITEETDKFILWCVDETKSETKTP